MVGLIPTITLWCVWMRQFKKVIHSFVEFEFLWSKMNCLDKEIKSKLKLRNFKKVFQITKLIEFEIHLKNKEIEISQLMEFLIGQDKKGKGWLNQ